MGQTKSKENTERSNSDGKKSDKPQKGSNKGKKSKRSRVLQVLVAGAAQSGKSTFFKQLQIIHLNGFSDEQKQEVLKTLRSNVILGFKELTEHYDSLKKRPHIASGAKDSLEYFRQKNPYDVFDDTTKDSAKKLWTDKGFLKLWKDRDTIPGLSILTLDYLMEHLDRLSTDALPDMNDILHARKRTTGTNEIEFQYKSKDFRFVDVGGQKSERRHWDQIIEKPEAVVFFVALTDWNLSTAGNPEMTKLQEAIEIFGDVMEFPAFEGTFWILMLNKIDLFREKIKRVPLKDTFEDYEGPENDPEEAVKFISQKFLSKVPEENLESVQAHVTCALDTEQMKTVFNAMQTAMLERLMSNFGML